MIVGIGTDIIANSRILKSNFIAFFRKKFLMKLKQERKIQVTAFISAIFNQLFCCQIRQI